MPNVLSHRCIEVKVPQDCLFMFISQRTGERSMILDLLYLMRQKTSQTKIGFKKRTQSPGHSFQNVTQTHIF